MSSLSTRYGQRSERQQPSATRAEGRLFSSTSLLMASEGAERAGLGWYGHTKIGGGGKVPVLEENLPRGLLRPLCDLGAGLVLPAGRPARALSAKTFVFSKHGQTQLRGKRDPTALPLPRRSTWCLMRRCEAPTVSPMFAAILACVTARYARSHLTRARARTRRACSRTRARTALEGAHGTSERREAYDMPRRSSS